ncbi:MAG: septal ring lytic transglycosylase RlpA family protein [Rivularia sp. (in: cyanobacteria)]
MNQKLLLTAVAVISTVIGTPSISRAQTLNEASIISQKESEKEIVAGTFKGSNTAVTKVFAHKLADRQAATLYIRNIPVFTFLSSVPVANSENKVTKVNHGVSVDSNRFDAVEKANTVAAKINDLVNKKVDANKITVSWNGTTESKSGAKALDERYIIKVDGSELVEINGDTRLPDATKNLRQDALQATNRLRRLVGKASPLKTIAGLPPELTEPKKQAIEETASSKHHTKKWRRAARGGRRFRGIASFYGAYFAGRKTASGERFNPSRMTAAHRTLPFGTRVRVTNMRNGRSVVVRINDRGPFIRGRVIDLSRGAAGVIGMIGRGIAPVRVEVLGR